MTHEEIRAGLLGALDRTLDPQELDEVERHVAECDDCRLEQVELFRMRRAMDREERVQEAAAVVPEPKRFGPIGLGGWVRLALVAAAAAALAMTFGHARPKVPPPDEEETGTFPVTVHPAP